jgi:ABC-type oligopeptide transport system ATPase subunit
MRRSAASRRGDRAIATRALVVADHVSLAFDDIEVLRAISFPCSLADDDPAWGERGRKSVVLKLILGLLKRDSGVIRVNGERIDTMTEVQLMKVRDDVGMLFHERRAVRFIDRGRQCRRQTLRGNVIVPADQRKRDEDEAEFIVLKDGRIYFEGSAPEMSASGESYLATFMSDGFRPLSHDPAALTIGFARRFATYKRVTLLLSDTDRLARLCGDSTRPVQFVFAGKAHPSDDNGKHLIRQIIELSRDSRLAGRLVFVEDYDVNIGRHFGTGCRRLVEYPAAAPRNLRHERTEDRPERRFEFVHP